jgi:uncharacterized RDD family membrane protein YckC
MSTVTRPPSAPFDARFSAYLIDGLILFAVFDPLMLSTFLARDINLWPLVLWVVGTHLYWAAFWSRLGRGQTPGMRSDESAWSGKMAGIWTLAIHS